MCRRLEDQLKRWHDGAKLIGRAWRAQQGLKQTLHRLSERVREADASFARKLGSLTSDAASKAGTVEELEQLPDAAAAIALVDTERGSTGSW